jgi:hypothetical protein
LPLSEIQTDENEKWPVLKVGKSTYSFFPQQVTCLFEERIAQVWEPSLDTESSKSVGFCVWL